MHSSFVALRLKFTTLYNSLRKAGFRYPLIVWEEELEPENWNKRWLWDILLQFARSVTANTTICARICKLGDKLSYVMPFYKSTVLNLISKCSVFLETHQQTNYSRISFMRYFITYHIILIFKAWHIEAIWNRLLKVICSVKRNSYGVIMQASSNWSHQC